MDNALFTHCRFYLFAYMNALALPAQIEHCFNLHTARKRFSGLRANLGVSLLCPCRAGKSVIAFQAITLRIAAFSKPRYLVANLDKILKNRYNIKVKKDFRLLL